MRIICSTTWRWCAEVEACFISTVPVPKVVSEKDETCFDKLVESLQEQILEEELIETGRVMDATLQSKVCSCKRRKI